MAKASILLESGTNEVEILEFVMGGRAFGVNVLKIQAIEKYDPKRVTRIHLAPPSVIGTLRFRDHCLTMIDLGREMGLHGAEAEAEYEDGKPTCGEGNAAKLVLVMEFNQLMTAFLVDGVHRIHRLSWESFNPLSPCLGSSETKFTGSLQIEGREILLVDMEKIVTEILPRGQFQLAVAVVEDGDLARIAGKCRAVGADAYISKPQFTQLVDLLDQHTGILEPAGA